MGQATLQDGKAVHRNKIASKNPCFDSGTILEIGSYIFEIDQPVAYQDYLSGTCFSENASLAAAPTQLGSLGGPQPKRFIPVHSKQAGGAAAVAKKAPAAFLHDPAAPDAVVLNAAQWDSGRGVLPSGLPVVPVVIDPYICRQLRPHQREGVKFMYECVMGSRDPSQTGCILADEMGLGKTLQVSTQHPPVPLGALQH
jgi:DNA repair and recombination protein RAD54B